MFNLHCVSRALLTNPMNDGGSILETIKPFSKRYGFETAGMKLLGGILAPFFKCRCAVPPTITALDEPVVFVCNHYEIFGPVAIALSLPLRYHFWINAMVLEAAENVEYMIPGTRHTFPFLSENVTRKLLRFAAPLIEKTLKRFRALPVYHRHLGKQRRTIEHSVDAMLNGENIVIFPETAIPAYSHGRVTEFYRSFALIGEVYRRRTGKSAVFCPLYIDRKHRKLCFGQPVRYGQEKAAAECEKLVTTLRNQILSMADEALGTAKGV